MSVIRVSVIGNFRTGLRYPIKVYNIESIQTNERIWQLNNETEDAKSNTLRILIDSYRCFPDIAP